MTDRGFKVVIRAGKGAGATLRAVLDKLGALEKLYEASASAHLRPGASRAVLPDGAKEVMSLRITEALPTNSLAVAVMEPFVPEDYESDYNDFPPLINKTFRKAVRAAVNRDSAQIIQLYPEKADQLRILQAIKDLSPTEDEEPVTIEGFDNLSTPLIFRQEHRAWAEQSRPSLAPETQTFTGMVRTGSLGGNAQFKLFDGGRTITLKPTSKGILQLRDYFGKVVEVTGLAHFTGTGIVKEVTDITSIEPFEYRSQEIIYGNRTFRLKEPLIYAAEAGIDTKSFTLSNSSLNSIGFGRSLTEAIDATALDFVAIWDDIAQADESELHDSALPLRALLRDLVIEVEE